MAMKTGDHRLDMGFRPSTRYACRRRLGGDCGGSGRLVEKILTLGWKVAKGNGGGLGGREAHGGGGEGGELVCRRSLIPPPKTTSLLLNGSVDRSRTRPRGVWCNKIS